MKKNVKNKLHFKKPEITEAEYVGCQVPIITVTIPKAATVAAACNYPMVAVALPVAIVV